MCAKPGPNGTWSPAVSGLRLEASGSIRGIVLGKQFSAAGRFGVPLDYNLYNAGFDAAWELDIFGGTRRAVEAANAEIGAAESSQRDVLVSLLAEVARNYIGARGYQQRLAITLQNIQVQQEILDLTSNRFENGLSSDLDVQQATAVADRDRGGSAFAGNRLSINPSIIWPCCWASRRAR